MLKESLSDSWSFFRNHLTQLTAIIIPIVAPIALVAAFLRYFLVNDASQWLVEPLLLLVQVVAFPFYAVGTILYMGSVIAGEPIGNKEAWHFAGRFWLRYILMISLLTIAVLLGFILLVIPGIILATRFTFSEFELIFKSKTPLDSIRESWVGTKNYFWVLLGGFVFLSLILYLPLSLIAGQFDTASFAYWVFDTATNIIYPVLNTLFTIFALRIYEFANSANME